MPLDKLYMGLDIGAISVKLAGILPQEDDALTAGLAASGFSVQKVRPKASEDLPAPESGQHPGFYLILSKYTRHYGEPIKTAEKLLTTFTRGAGAERITGESTGSGGKTAASRWNLGYINTTRAISIAVRTLYPEIRTVFELGGEKARYILLTPDENGSILIEDYEMNGECAAGTGSFFDQQVDRLKIRVEDVGGLIEGVRCSAAIAGRCSVFAKSDMIHAQQRGYSPPEVLKGLCEAVVRNFRGSVTKGKRIETPVAFIGGMAFNLGVVRAFRSLFGFQDGEMVIPENHAWMGAIGAALHAMNTGCSIEYGSDTGYVQSGSECGTDNAFKSPDRKNPDIEPGDPESSSIRSTGISSPKEPDIAIHRSYPTCEPLSMKRVTLLRDRVKPVRLKKGTVTDAYLGIDIGSVSTNLALIDGEGNLIHGIYTMTDGRPIETVEKALASMGRACGTNVNVKRAGTTGSGRELIGALIGADIVKDEITAHKTGAVFIAGKFLGREVDTIFEVGGQDSKFISIREGVVVDFSLNEACAAGTGSFLEERATQIGVKIRDEFAHLALKSLHPLKLGERCTVFMERELIPYMQQGVPREDIVAGLALSVVQNYLNRVVKKRRIGNSIFFQGGTAYNDAVAAAFATVLDKDIVVPPHNGIIGAIGVALLAKDRTAGHDTRFRGWDLGNVKWKLEEFTCDGCSNACSIQVFDMGGEKSYWGDKCTSRFRRRTKTERKAQIPDLVRHRNVLFEKAVHADAPLKKGKLVLPRILHLHDRMPFWNTYFRVLGYETVLSGPTTRETVQAGVETASAEPCFPVQAALGHLKLLKGNDAPVFCPNVIDEEDPTDSVASYICPWTQTLPLVAGHTPGLKGIEEKLVCPTVRFREGPRSVEKQLWLRAKKEAIPRKLHIEAVRKAYEAQAMFNSERQSMGKEVMDMLHRKKLEAVLLLGRPYNLYDPALNLNIPAKLRDRYGVNVIPMDFLAMDPVPIHHIHDHMFWNYGRRILQAACMAREWTNMHIIYLSNFKCGPDSYIRHYIEEASGRPFLFLQLDSHANDAGIMTRVEAFLESKGLL